MAGIQDYVKKRAEQEQNGEQKSGGVSEAVSKYVKTRADSQRAAAEKRQPTARDKEVLRAYGAKAVKDFVSGRSLAGAMQQSYDQAIQLKEIYERTGDYNTGRAFLTAAEQYNKKLQEQQKKLAARQISAERIEDGSAESQIGQGWEKRVNLDRMWGTTPSTANYDRKIGKLQEQLKETEPSTENMQDASRYEIMQELREQEKKKEEYIPGAKERLDTKKWEEEKRLEIQSTKNPNLMQDLKKLNQLHTASGLGEESFAAQAQEQYDALYSRLRSEYGDQVDDWMVYAGRVENAESMQEMVERIEEVAKEKPVTASLVTPIVNVTSGAGAVDVAVQKLQKAVSGSEIPIDYNRAAQLGSNWTNTTRETVSKKIVEDTAEKYGEDSWQGKNLGKIYSFLYNTGMSMADSLVIRNIPGGTVLLGGAAATSTMNEARERGASTEQALSLAFFAGMAETVMEKASIDSLFNLKEPENVKQALWNILKQGGAEGTEEVLTTLVNTLSDAIIMGSRSELESNAAEYRSWGYSEEKAEKLAFVDWVIGVAGDYLGGMVSGSLFASMQNLSLGIYNQKYSKPGDVVQNETVPERSGTENLNMELRTDEGMVRDSEVELRQDEGVLRNSETELRTDGRQARFGEDVGNQGAEAQPENGNTGEEIDAGNLQTLGNLNFERGIITESQERRATAGDAVDADMIQWEGNIQENETGRVNTDEGEQQQADLGAGGDGAGIDQRSDGGREQNPRRESARAAVRRAEEARRVQANVQALGGEVTSLYELGLSNGSQERTNRIVKRDAWTAEIEEAADIADSEGLELRPLLGMLNVEQNGKQINANAILSDGTIYVRADSTKQSVRESVLHEAFHQKARENPGLVERVAQRIRETYSREETQTLFERYYTLYQKAFGGTLTDEEAESYIWEEMLADAYAEFQRYADTFGTAQWNAYVVDEVWNGAEQDGSGTGDNQRFSIVTIEGMEDDYGEGVLLDTDIFNRVKPREWSKVLSKFVYKNMAGKEMVIYDENGREEIVHIAKSTDRVKKENANNSHKVLDELSRYKGDNVKALATVHLSELLATSEHATTTDDKKHQWLDENGWIRRKAYVETKDGKIYEATLNIADGKRGLMMYKISQVHQIDTKREGTPTTEVPDSLETARSITHVPSGESIAKRNTKVKTKFSVNEDIDEQQTLPSGEDKAKAKAERELSKGLADIMSVPTSQVKGLREGPVRRFMEAWQQTGEVDQNLMDTMIAEAYAKGLSVDNEYYETYKPVKDYLRTTALTISEQDRADIPDFTQFRKKAFGTLKLVNQGGVPVDVAYQELTEQYPGLLPSDITHPADQLVTLYEKAKKIRKVEIQLEKSLGDQADQFYTWAEERMQKLLERTLEKYADKVKWTQRKEQRDERGWEANYQPSMDTYDRANERLANYGQLELDGTRESRAPAVERSAGEKAARGSVKDWLDYVFKGELSPEEFAELAAAGKLRERTRYQEDILGRIGEGKDQGHLVRGADMSDEEYEALDAAWRARRETRAEATATENEWSLEKEITRKMDFRGTPAMDKLGIKIDGTVTRYRNTEQLRAQDKAARQAENVLRKRIQELKPTSEEQRLARDLADGVISATALNEKNMNVGKVVELADYMMAARSFAEDMISQRRSEIDTTNYKIAGELFRDSDTYHPKLKAADFTKLVMNERTPERVLRQIFGKEQGEKIYRTYFRPVWVNGAEMNRFESRMQKRVEMFEDQGGTKRKLTMDERAMAQRLMEAQAVEESVAKLPKAMQEKVKKAASLVNDGEDFNDTLRKFGLDGEEKTYYQGLVQAYADYMDAVTISEGMDRTVMQNAIKEYGKIYNELYDAINDFLVSHGYREIGFIKGYAPHFQKQEVQQGLFGALKNLGVEKESVSALPTNIAGRTADFKPNHKWNPHMQHRKGSSTDYDIQIGYEQYLHYAAEIFYHTDDVMRIRQAVNWFRQQYSGENISQAIEDAKVDQYKNEAWKQEFLEKKGEIAPGQSLDNRTINGIFDKYVDGLFAQAAPESLSKYSEFATWMDDYANIIAGKQSLASRGLEGSGGRVLLNWGNKLIRSFSSANVAGNLSSVLNQTAQLPLIQQQLGTYMERAALDMMRGGLSKENFAERSDFLTDKQGVEKLTTTGTERFISGLFKPAEMMDRMVSTLAVRGRYLQALDEGLDIDAAMVEADDFGRRVMGSRMKGAKPLAFENKGVISQMLHVFQVEASNTFDYMLLSDMPQAMQEIGKTKGKAAAARWGAAAACGYVLNAFLLNRLTETVYGGSPAPFDLLGWGLNFIAGGFGWSDDEFLKMLIDNGWEKLFGERLFGTEPMEENTEFDWAGSLKNLGYNVSNDVPYLRNVSGVLGWGDETTPTAGLYTAAADFGEGVSTLWNQLTKGEEETGLSWAGALNSSADALGSAAQAAIPGGRQMKKTLQGLITMLRGGKYNGDRLQFPVEQNVWNTLQAALFGTSALGEADAFYASGRSGLSAGQSKKVAELEEKFGIDRFTGYELYQEFREIEQDLSGTEASAAKRHAINALNLTDQQKLETYTALMLRGTADNAEEIKKKFEAMLGSGLTWDDVTQAHDIYSNLYDDETLTGLQKATEFAKWVDQEGWSEEQKETVEKRFRFFNMSPVQATNYEKLEAAGLDPEKAADLALELGKLEPEEGKESVTVNQKVLAIEASKLSESEKVSAIIALVPEKREELVEAGVSENAADRIGAELALEEAKNGDEELTALEKAKLIQPYVSGDEEYLYALSTVLTRSTYMKLEVANGYGVSASTWVDFRDAWTSTYGDNSMSQDKAEMVLDSMTLTKREKAVLWQILNKSWKPKNNPYNREVAEEIYEKLNEEE